MTTFKPGDRVISPLLVGEWEVEGYPYWTMWWVWVRPLANMKASVLVPVNALDGGTND